MELFCYKCHIYFQVTEDHPGAELGDGLREGVDSDGLSFTEAYPLWYFPCPECGTSIAADDYVPPKPTSDHPPCPKCAEPLADTQRLWCTNCQFEWFKCPLCQTEWERGSRYCVNCGKSLREIYKGAVERKLQDMKRRLRELD